MAKDAMLACICCNTPLRNVTDDVDNQPSEGTEFRTFGHYGSTFWDSMDGEEIVINVCDTCLQTHTGAIARHKRYVSIVVVDPTTQNRVPVTVGRQWITREMVPYFPGPEDTDQVTIEPEEIGSLPDSYGRIEWVQNWREIKRGIVDALDESETGHSCYHTHFVAECTRCGARPLEGRR